MTYYGQGASRSGIVHSCESSGTFPPQACLGEIGNSSPTFLDRPSPLSYNNRFQSGTRAVQSPRACHPEQPGWYKLLF